MPLTDAQREARKSGVGGSDVAALWSLPPYHCRRKLWYDKTRTAEDYPAPPTPAMERGTHLEELAARLYQEQTGRKVRRRTRAVRHPELPALVHVDRVIQRIEGRVGRGILEIKCPGTWEYRRIRKEGLPEAYLLQLQHALWLTNYWWGAFCIFNAEIWEITTFDVDLDPEIVGRIEEAIGPFWRQVENGPPPERLEPGDRRCRACPWRRTCWAGVADAARHAGGDESEDESLAPLVAEVVEAGRLADEAEGLLEDARARLKARMGDRLKVRTSAGRALVTVYDQTTLDAPALRRDHPEIAAQYARVKMVRSLKVLPGD